MVGAPDRDVAGRERAEQAGHGLVDLAQPGGEAGDVVAVPPDLVEVDQVGEQQAAASSSRR